MFRAKNMVDYGPVMPTNLLDMPGTGLICKLVVNSSCLGSRRRTTNVQALLEAWLQTPD
jgi:hypothetical protein